MPKGPVDSSWPPLADEPTQPMKEALSGHFAELSVDPDIQF